MSALYDHLVAGSIRVGPHLLWVDPVTPNGYGTTQWEGRKCYVHRLMYEAVHGPIPPGHVVDHRCFRKDCIEPSHLRALTVSGNGLNRKGAAAHSKTGIRGVSRVLYRARTPWKAQVTVRGVVHREFYATKDQAAIAVVEMRRRLGVD